MRNSPTAPCARASRSASIRGPVWRTYQKDSPCGRTHCVVGIVTECAINGNGQCKLGLGTDRLGVRITPQVKRLIKSK